MTVRPPAHLSPYVEVLGQDDAVEFFLTFGGADLYLTERSRGRSEVATRFGIERATALARALGDSKTVRVPTAKPWVAHVLCRKGLPTNEIARRLHASNVAVRRWLAGPSDGSTPGAPRARRSPRSPDPRQLPLI